MNILPPQCNEDCYFQNYFKYLKYDFHKLFKYCYLFWFHRSLEIYFWFLLISDITLQFLYFTLGQNSISNLINQREGNLR